MEAPDYWRAHYVTGANGDEIAQALRREPFTSAREQLELVHFFCGREASNILVSQGSGGHAYVFAELGYHLNQAGYNVFIMPKHGGRTISQLLTRHLDALEHTTATSEKRPPSTERGSAGMWRFTWPLHMRPWSAWCARTLRRF